MNQITFFESKNQTILFTQFADEEGLPFPLYLSLHWKLVISISLLLSLVFGFSLRLIIFSYLRSPESNLGPINYLIWLDEVNGLLNSFVIVVRIVMIHSTLPLDAVFGQYFGRTVGFLSCCYSGGRCIWSFYIALYRIMFIFAQNWLTKTVGIKRFLKTLVSLGMVQVLILSFIFNEFDLQGSILKSSSHLSTPDMEILISMQVKYSI